MNLFFFWFSQSGHSSATFAMVTPGSQRVRKKIPNDNHRISVPRESIRDDFYRRICPQAILERTDSQAVATLEMIHSDTVLGKVHHTISAVPSGWVVVWGEGPFCKRNDTRPCVQGPPLLTGSCCCWTGIANTIAFGQFPVGSRGEKRLGGWNVKGLEKFYPATMRGFDGKNGC